ncbi:hypothetical protein [Endozoicomonas acroporae]|uniref:hypothetical protein n=1 Tax=Endozoicomonas acroporae TaxID=1701104 RepID=UPI003D7C05AA
MISQPTAQSTGAATASGSIPVQPGEKWGVWAGVKVAFWDGVIPFLQSWHPDYVPPGAQPDKGPAFTFGSPGGKDGSFFEGVELAARLVSPYTVLPAEIGTMLQGFITLSSAARLRDLFGATKGSPPGQSQADSPVDCSPTNDKGRKKKKPQQTPQRTSPLATASVGPGQLPKAAVALGALSGLSAAAAASPSGNKTEVWIDVPNATILGKIGHDPDYQLNGRYRQTADIDGSQLNQSIGSKTDPFTGEYDGQCRTISNLFDCFVGALNGSIRHLRFIGANINSTEVTGLAACVVDVNGTVSGIWAENVHIFTSGENAWAGIGGGSVRGTVANTTAVNSRVETSGDEAYAGIGGGWVKGMVAKTTAVNSTVKTSGVGADAGIGGGKVEAGGSVASTTAVNSGVETSGDYAYAGIGGGWVEAEGTVNKTTAVNSWVITKGNYSDVGIGGGSVKGTVTITTAVNSMVETSGIGADAGIGGGVVNGGKVDITTAVSSRVKTSGESAQANIGGEVVFEGTVDNTMAVNSYVNNVNITNSESISNGQLLCQKADQRVLTDNCSSRTEFLDALYFSYSDACPVNDAAATTASIPISTLQPIKVTNAETSINVSGLSGATMTLPITVASSAATLSTGAVAGIVLGTAAFVAVGVVAGRYIYRHYCHGSSVADDPQELVAINNTVGQAQKACTQPTIK